MSNNDEYKKPAFTASYVANLTLSKLAGSVDFSRSKVCEGAGEKPEEADEVLAALNILDCYGDITRAMLKGTHTLRQRGKWSCYKAEEVAMLREATEAFRGVVDKYLDGRNRDDRFSNDAG